MANTYTQLLVHLVFAVNHRQAQISTTVRPKLESYISGIILNRKHKLLAQYCMPDHIHILVGLNPDDSISNLVRDIKSSSSKWINQNGYTRNKFNWQKGYGAFSHNRSDLKKIINYILNQPLQHQKKNFFAEYVEILEKCRIDYNHDYLFK